MIPNPDLRARIFIIRHCMNEWIFIKETKQEQFNVYNIKYNFYIKQYKIET